jgi:small multidrug resistance family-3 protein
VAEIVRALSIFFLAGLAEIGGGWLVWQWLRAGQSYWYGVGGALVLFLYGVLPTLQREAAFGRVYAAYGGLFILMALLWGWWVDGWRPDLFDWLGASIAVLGVLVILWGRSWFA